MTDLTDERLAEIEQDAELFRGIPRADGVLALIARLRAAEERAEAAEKDASRLKAALTDLIADPHSSCPFCDYGWLRDQNKPHAEDCRWKGFIDLSAALAASEKGEG